MVIKDSERNLQTLNNERRRIRKEARSIRRALSERKQYAAAFSLQQLVRRQPFFLRSKTFAYYIANDGEIDPTLIRDYASKKYQRIKQFFLPVIRPMRNGKLWFLSHPESNQNKSLQLNEFGIPEPRLGGKPIPLTTLDVVFLPLVAFDKTGARLGMGGGFYDKSFAFKKKLTGKKKALTKPLLIGLAHHSQEWEQLPTEAWDIPLDAIITDKNIVLCKPLPLPCRQRLFLQNDLRIDA